MFSNAYKPDPSFDEGEIVQVDYLRKTCKVKTLRGQNLSGVLWPDSDSSDSRGGDRSAPRKGARVLLFYGLGYPIILRFLPKVGATSDAYALSLDSGVQGVDTGSDAEGSTSALNDPGRVGDSLGGDRVIASEGGALLGILRGGSALLRGSRLSQIILSKLGDVVKVISRNWEHYTDVSTDIVRNFRGRVYRYIGYSNDYLKSKTESYSYHQFIGDVSAAEAVKAGYMSPPSSIPDKSNLLFKEQVTREGAQVMNRTLSEDGVEIVKIEDGTFTERSSNHLQIQLTYNGENTITINNETITLARTDGAIVTLKPTGIHLEFASGTVDLTNSGISSEYSSHYVRITDAGVQLG